MDWIRFLVKDKMFRICNQGTLKHNLNISIHLLSTVQTNSSKSSIFPKILKYSLECEVQSENNINFVQITIEYRA